MTFTFTKPELNKLCYQSHIHNINLSLSGLDVYTLKEYGHT